MMKTDIFAWVEPTMMLWLVIDVTDWLPVGVRIFVGDIQNKISNTSTVHYAPKWFG